MTPLEELESFIITHSESEKDEQRLLALLKDTTSSKAPPPALDAVPLLKEAERLLKEGGMAFGCESPRLVRQLLALVEQQREDIARVTTNRDKFRKLYEDRVCIQGEIEDQLRQKDEEIARQKAIRKDVQANLMKVQADLIERAERAESQLRAFAAEKEKP